MAGKGPSPKLPDQRRRRNAPAAGEWRVLPAEPYRGKRPNLPRVPRGLLASSKATWEEWWSSPMAHMWPEADWGRLQVAIATHDTITRRLAAGDIKGLASTMAELRQTLDSLGLTPKGRQDRRWLLPADAEEATPDVPDDELAKRREKSNVRRLKAVDSS